MNQVFDTNITTSRQARDELFENLVQSLMPSEVMTRRQCEDLFYCNKCNKSPSCASYNNSNNPFHFAIRLNCDECHQSWNVCRSCGVQSQPTSFVRVSRRQRINGSDRRVTASTMRTIVDAQLQEHLQCHELQDDAFIINHNEEFNRTDVQENTLDPIQISTNIVETAIDSMFDTNSMSEFELKLKEALHERETNSKYPDYLIKKYWIQNMNCQFTEDDVILFLRYARLLLKSSRDDNKEICFIINALLKQKKKRLDDLQEKYDLLRSKMSLAIDTISSLEQLIKGNNISHDIPLPDVYEEINSSLSSRTESVINFEELPVVEISLPSTTYQVRKLLEGRNSLLNHILIPPIKAPRDMKPYVLPSCILKLAISTGVPFEIIKGSQYENISLHPRSIYRAATFKNLIRNANVPDDELVVLYGYWSDGCYFGTESKGIRNQAHMTTIHIAHHNVTLRHVFPIMFGKKDCDDVGVKRILIQDMINLSKESVACYVPSLRKVANVRFILGYLLQDRPEHSETTSFMGAGGTFSKRVGLSCPLTSISSNRVHQDEENLQYTLVKKLASCEECIKQRLDHIQNLHFHEASRSRRCRSCYDWDLETVEYVPHEKFPMDVVPDNEKSIDGNCLKSKIITFETMKNACQIIYQKVCDKTWTTLEEPSQFARRECIRRETWRKVYDAAKVVTLDGIVRSEDHEFIVPESLLPPFWNQDMISLDQVHLGVMHFLFLNIGSHLLMILRSLLSENNCWGSFYVHLNDKLKEIRKMSLSWCKAWTLGSTNVPGSMWVSENYLAFGILCKWLGSCILDVNENFDLTKDVLNLLAMYNTIVSHVMSPDLPSATAYRSVTSFVKVFLSLVGKFCNKIERTEVNKVETASCFVNLLSLGHKMKEYGVIRNFWEGGFRGEGVILPFKGLIKRGLHQNGTAHITMKKQYLHIAMDDLIEFKRNESAYTSFLDEQMSTESNEDIEDRGTASSEDDTAFNASRYRRFHCYKNIDHVVSQLTELKAVASAFHIVTRTLYCFIGNKSRSKKLLKLNIDESQCLYGTWIHNLRACADSITLDTVSNDAKEYLSCILLPLSFVTNINDEGKKEIGQKYFIINEHHQEMDRHSCFKHVNIFNIADNDELYQNISDRNEEEHLSTEDYLLYSNRTECIKLVGRRVRPLDDNVYAEVSSFHFERNICNGNNARWKIKHFRNETDTRSRKIEVCHYTKLKSILLLEE